MISYVALFWIVMIHWLADFVLQTHEQAIGKSYKWSCLLNHTSTYSTVWFLFGLMYITCTVPLYSTSNTPILNVLAFTGITFVCHTIQDYFTSRWVKYYFDKNNFHNGFVVIGLDQILHYSQLLLTYNLLKNG